jgi:hypothetical protein
VVQCLQDAARYARVRARMPSGVLLSGPPGTGKTLLAKAVAGEAGVPFIAMSASEFVELFVGAQPCVGCRPPCAVAADPAVQGGVSHRPSVAVGRCVWGQQSLASQCWLVHGQPAGCSAAGTGWPWRAPPRLAPGAQPTDSGH